MTAMCAKRPPADWVLTLARRPDDRLAAGIDMHVLCDFLAVEVGDPADADPGGAVP
jgi:hypothetical protein